MFKRLAKILFIGFVWGGSVMSNLPASEAAALSSFIHNQREPSVLIELNGEQQRTLIPVSFDVEDGHVFKTLYKERRSYPDSHTLDYFGLALGTNKASIQIVTDPNGNSCLCVSYYKGDKIKFCPLVPSNKNAQYYEADTVKNIVTLAKELLSKLLRHDPRQVYPDFVPSDLNIAQAHYAEAHKTQETPLQA